MKNPSWNETKRRLNSQNYPIPDMIFSAQELVSKISHDMTLLARRSELRHARRHRLSAIALSSEVGYRLFGSAKSDWTLAAMLFQLWRSRRRPCVGIERC